MSKAKVESLSGGTGVHVWLVLWKKSDAGSGNLREEQPRASETGG